MRRRLLAGVVRLLGTTLIAGLLGATLVRVAPGFGYDPSTYDPRLTDESRQALRQLHAPERNIVIFYAHYVSAVVRGDWGESISLNQPVRQLVRERLPVTLRTMGLAIVIAWFLAVLLAGAVEITGWRALELFAAVANAGLLSAPAAVLALLCVLLRWPAMVAITAIIFAYLFSYASAVFRDHFARPHVLSALARGSGRMRVLLVHVFSTATPELLTLMGLSVATAFAATLPVEVLADVPGIGQLAWQAALGRDLPLIVMLTLLVTTLSVTAAVISDILRGILQEQRA